MSPWTIAKSGTEHGEQAALFAWANMAQKHGFLAANDEKSYTKKGYAEQTYGITNAVNDLKWFHAIPNGGSRGDTATSRAIEGGKLKAEGVKSGVADTFLPIPVGNWHGLYIELKKAKNGMLSKSQNEFGEFVKSQGYGWVCCNGWIEATKVIESYINWGN